MIKIIKIFFNFIKRLYRRFPHHLWNRYGVLRYSDILPRGGDRPIPWSWRNDFGGTIVPTVARYFLNILEFRTKEWFQTRVWNIYIINSLVSGVGYATMTIVFFLDVYYCIIIAWTLFYLISTFVNIPNVPWKGCGSLINRQIKFLLAILWLF